MMPHPERMIDNLISNSDGIELFTSIFKLMKITKEIIELHGLKLDEYSKIKIFIK